MSSLCRQEAADGDVAFNVHHHNCLTAADRLKRQISAEVRIAGGIDDDVDQAAQRKLHRVFDEGEASCLDQAIDGVAVPAEPSPLGVDTGYGSRFLGHSHIEFGNRTQRSPGICSIWQMMSVPI